MHLLLFLPCVLSSVVFVLSTCGFSMYGWDHQLQPIDGGRDQLSALTAVSRTTTWHLTLQRSEDGCTLRVEPEEQPVTSVSRFMHVCVLSSLGLSHVVFFFFFSCLQSSLM